MDKMRMKDRIINFIKKKGQSSVDEMTNFFGVSRQIIHRHLSELVKAGFLYRIGKPPKVYYLMSKEEEIKNTGTISGSLKKIIDENYSIITPAGEQKEGWEGFMYWCKKQKLPFEKTALEYEQTLKKYKPYKKNGLIDGMYKMKHTFDHVYLDKVFYLDFYSIERFGKTRLGQLLLYAKQSQNRDLIRELVTQIKPKINQLVHTFSVNAVGFIPPTVRREIQLMKEFERQLNLSIPSINLVKVKTPIVVPQKTLTKLEDRIENAKNTIVVDDNHTYDTILLIDDALGSGSTLNETAQKIKKQKLAKMIVGLAITGSFSGFEVISEV
jgi:DNA-binding transcriptional regulator YhcF (GntR family)/hypoxanthine-guanine phosphoribosyltransferase